MVIFDETFKYTDLKAKCKEFGIPRSGIKHDLITRLNEYVKSIESQESSDALRLVLTKDDDFYFKESNYLKMRGKLIIF